MTEKPMSKEYCLELSGDFACFTRPELKVERVSYDVITPRLHAISSKPSSGNRPYAGR